MAKESVKVINRFICIVKIGADMQRNKEQECSAFEYLIHMKTSRVAQNRCTFLI